MNCIEIKEMLSLYLDGELDDKDKKIVEDHIANCEDCRNELEEYKNMIQILQELPEEEPPKGYCSRLHEKLLNSNFKKKSKFRWVKYTSIAACLALVFIIYISSNSNNWNLSKSENSVAYDSKQSIIPAEIQSEMAPTASEENYLYDKSKEDSISGGVEERETGSNLNGSTMMTMDAPVSKKEMKIVKSGNVVAKTEDYNVFMDNIMAKVSSYKGYIEQNNSSVYNVYNGRELRYGYLKIRVPQDKFYEFINYLESVSDVNQKNVSEIDLTKEYYEKDNRVKNLEIQEEHLRLLFEKATTVEEILQIENELRRVRTEIDELNISLKDIDDRASMSTLNLEIEEVMPANIGVKNKESLGERAKKGFINTVNEIIETGENIVISLVSLSPILVPLIIVLIVVYIKFIKKK